MADISELWTSDVLWPVLKKNLIGYKRIPKKRKIWRIIVLKTRIISSMIG